MKGITVCAVQAFQSVESLKADLACETFFDRPAQRCRKFFFTRSSRSVGNHLNAISGELPDSKALPDGPRDTLVYSPALVRSVR